MKNNNKVLIVGINGFLGKELAGFLKEKSIEVFGTTHTSNVSKNIFQFKVGDIINSKIFPMVLTNNKVYRFYLHLGNQGDCYFLQQEIDNPNDKNVITQVLTTIDDYCLSEPDGSWSNDSNYKNYIRLGSGTPAVSMFNSVKVYGAIGGNV